MELKDYGDIHHKHKHIHSVPKSHHNTIDTALKDWCMDVFHDEEKCEKLNVYDFEEVQIGDKEIGAIYTQILSVPYKSVVATDDTGNIVNIRISLKGTKIYLYEVDNEIEYSSGELEFENVNEEYQKAKEAQAQGALTQAQGALNQAEVALILAKKQLDTAVTRHGSRHRVWVSQHARGAGAVEAKKEADKADEDAKEAKKEEDKAAEAVKTAKKEVKTAEESLALAKSKITTAQGALTQAQGALNQAEGALILAKKQLDTAVTRHESKHLVLVMSRAGAGAVEAKKEADKADEDAKEAKKEEDKAAEAVKIAKKEVKTAEESLALAKSKITTILPNPKKYKFKNEDNFTDINNNLVKLTLVDLVYTNLEDNLSDLKNKTLGLETYNKNILEDKSNEDTLIIPDEYTPKRKIQYLEALDDTVYNKIITLSFYLLIGVLFGIYCIYFFFLIELK